MKKKITAVALAVCILVVGIVGATMSYFTDKDTATNTFTFGEGVDIKLTESSIAWNDGKADSTTYSEFNLYGATNGTGLENYLTGGLTYDNVIPGRHYSKAPHVELVNSGKSDPAYIVVTATYPEGRPFNLGGLATVTDLLVTPNTTTGVDVTVEKVGNTYFYYFPNAVQPGTVVTPFQWMQLDGSVNNADTNAQSGPFNVEVKAYAVLAAGFNDCKTAFKAAFADVVGDMSDTQTNSATAGADGAATFTVSAAPVNGSSTTVALTGLAADTEYTLSATTYGIESAPASFQVVGNDDAVAAITVSLTKAQGAAADFNGTATITTYIAKGLTNPQVIYSGTGAQPTFVSYDSTTGELVFKTTHFSTYIVTANVAAYNKTTNTAYKTLADAVAAVGENQTVVLTKDVTGGGVMIKEADAKALTIDLNGKTYTFTDPAVGSTGTETQGFHFEKGCTITVKNGKLDAANNNQNVKMMIQNYCDLTLDGVEMDGTNLNGSSRYVLSNNCGTTTIKNSKITAKTGDFAFDSCKFADYAIPTVKLDNATIEGNVELSGGNLEFVSDLALKNGRIELNYANGGTIDLNGKKITRTGGTGNGSAFDVKQGNWTIKNGTIDCTGVTGTTNNQGSPYDVETDAITVRAGETTLENLKVDVVSKTGACAYAFDGGKIYVKSGSYSNATSETYANDNKMLLNQADNADQAIFVSGGTFYGANPADGDNSGKPASFLAEGYTATGADNVWTVAATSAAN